MLVSDIITNGALKADVSNVAFYTPAEGLIDAQAAWSETYAWLIDNNDDFYATELYIASTSFVADTNRTNLYTYTLPSDFCRIRILQYGNQNGIQGFWPCSKMTTEDYGRAQNSPAYKIMGANLKIYDPVKYPVYYMLYYPLAATITASTDLVYPNSLVSNILMYQIAIEIRRKQKLDVELWEARRDELRKSMIRQLPRDDFKAEKPKNEFGGGFNPYI
jgi:hypothetical protein